nr:hypothetical protein [Natronospira proteinivora]
MLATTLTLVGCLADDMDTDEGPDFGGNGGPPSADTYSVSGQAVGIGDTPVQLSLSGGENLTVDADGGFEFQTELEDGDSYSVSISDVPGDRQCGLANSDGSVDGQDVDDVQLDCTMISATADIMQVHLAWTGPSTVDLVYSTDPDCDWGNYASCDDGGRISGASGHESTLVAVEEGMVVDAPLYFVVESEAVRSEVAGARAAAPSFWGFGGAREFAEADGRLYMVGDIVGVGMATPGGLTVDRDTAAPRGSMPRFTAEEFGAPDQGVVATAEPDGAGGWYLGGLFSEVDGVERPSVAHVNADGSLNESFDPEILGGEILGLSLVDGRLYVAGEFEDQSSTVRALAAMDPETGELVGDFSPMLDGAVLAMLEHDGHLYIGGEFNEIEGISGFGNLAVFDLSSDEVVSDWQPQASDSVWTLAAQGDSVFAGGEFDEIDGQSVGHVAAIDTVSGNLNPSWDAGLDGPVLALEIHDDTLYVGGQFTETSQAIERTSLAAFDVADGGLSDWAPEALDDPGDPALIRGLSYQDGRIYVAGNMVVVDDDLAMHAAALDPVDGSPDVDWRPWLTEYGSFGEVDLWEITPGHNGEVFIGGLVDGYLDGSDHLHVGVAAFDAETGVVDRDWTGYVFPAGVDAVETANSRLYIGGDFGVAGSGPFDLATVLSATPPGEPRDNLAAYDLSDGGLDGWAPDGASNVNAIVADDSYLYVGMNDFSADHLSAFDLETGQEHAGLDGAGFNGQVRDLLLHNGYLYIGGAFSEDASGEDRDHLAALNPSTGNLNNWDPSVDSPVNVLIEHNGDIYIGGDFTEANGDDRDFLAAFSAEDTPDPTLRSWAPSASDSVYALSVDGDRIFVGGDFTEIDGNEQSGLAAVNASNGNLDLGWRPTVNGPVFGLHVEAGAVRAGGEFTLVNEQLRSGIALLDAISGDLVLGSGSSYESYQEPQSMKRASLLSSDRRILSSPQDERELGDDVDVKQGSLLEKLMGTERNH